MRGLNTQDFIDTAIKLEEAKDDSILGAAMAQALAYAHLATILRVCIEWDKSFNETQDTIDKYTFINQGRLNAHFAKVESNG